jgi:hypothetical protein
MKKQIVTIENLINKYKEIKSNSNPQKERPREFYLEKEAGIGEFAINQALLRTKCLQYLLSEFSKYTPEEIDYICEYNFLSDGIKKRVMLHKEKGKEIFEKVKNIIVPDKDLEKKLDRIEPAQHMKDYPKNFEKDDINDFCHHFNPAWGTCYSLSINDLWDPYKNIEE